MPQSGRMLSTALAVISLSPSPGGFTSQSFCRWIQHGCRIAGGFVCTATVGTMGWLAGMWGLFVLK